MKNNASTLSTTHSLVFKPAVMPQHAWLQYGVTLALLLIVVLMLAKKHGSRSPTPASCQLIEKKHLGNKTVVYIIRYQQQRFLLADNQQALAIHPLTPHPHELSHE